MATIKGFSKFSKAEKQQWIASNFFSDTEEAIQTFNTYQVENAQMQDTIDGISENVISNFVLPYGVAPNFVIDGKSYAVPMVIEESSVIAAAAAAAKFWSTRGGFKTTVIATEKIGQVHFLWKGDEAELKDNFSDTKRQLIEHTRDITSNMEKRGGGILDVILKDKQDIQTGLFQLHATFETCDSMGANFVNTVLEAFAGKMEEIFQDKVEVIMSILSNYTPQCIVRAEVSAPLDSETPVNGLPARQFARRFKTAVAIASNDVYRATTHNKGFFNGVDAVALATGNDFRAIEACGHAYASRSGSYASISQCTIEDDTFRFWVDLPIALGTVGGLTKLHPLAKASLDMLENPSAKELMSIFACVGLAQNFAAVRSLVTTGIQKGHMKMHLSNILNQLGASKEDAKAATSHFSNKLVSVSGVRDYLAKKS